MTKLLLAFMAGLFALPAGAVTFTFGNEFSGSGGTCTGVNNSCATLNVTSIAGGVNFTLTGTMSGAEFIGGLYGNISPYAVPTNAPLAGFSFSENGFKADGDGYFDWFLDLPQSGDVFTNSDVLSWDFLGLTLTQLTTGLSSGGTPGKDGFLFALHGQGLNGTGNSGWFNGVTTGTPPPPPPPPSVPEPGTLGLLGAGMIGLGWTMRKRRQEGEDA